MKPAHIALPFTRQRWSYWLLAGITLPLGLLLLCLAVYLAIAGTPEGTLYCALFALILLMMGAAALFQTLVWLHLVPEGIALTLGPYTLRRIPAADLRLVCRVQRPDHRGPAGYTVLSRLSLDELAGLREQQLARIPYMRSGIPYRKRQSDWQHKFAAEYLRSQSNHVLFGYLRRDLLWLETAPEINAALELMYGSLTQWEDFPSRYISASGPWRDPDPLRFCRGQCRPGGRTGALIACLIFILSPAAVFLIPDTGYAFLPFLLLSALFGTIWVLSRDDYDVVHPEAAGIRVTRAGKMLGTMPAEEIKVILRSEMPTGYFAQGLLAVSVLPLEEVVEREAARLNRSPYGRRLLHSWQQIPGWEERLFVRSCLRLPTMEDFRARGVLVMAGTPDRARVLEELYPNARLIHVDKLGTIRS